MGDGDRVDRAVTTSMLTAVRLVGKMTNAPREEARYRPSDPSACARSGKSDGRGFVPDPAVVMDLTN